MMVWYAQWQAHRVAQEAARKEMLYREWCYRERAELKRSGIPSIVEVTAMIYRAWRRPSGVNPIDLPQKG